MEERDINFIIGSKINTLEESLKLFDKSCLLEQLDINLELVRREKVTKDQHLHLLKSIDKDLLKQSQIHHPDKAIRQKKSDGEVAKAQNLQTALNATRTVLKALTEVFLKDIDVHYKYEFFAKLDISTLINEKQIDLEINNVLCKISRLSEVKRVNIIGEIRKFLQESRDCLRNFMRGRNHDFVRLRSHALRHLHKCIKGYKMLATECKLIVEECSNEKDENTRGVIQKIYEESLRESEFLQNLEIVAKRSLDGPFEIFPSYRYREYYFMKRVKYEPVESKEQEYFVLPFILYVNVLLMCSVMVDKKPRGKNLVTKIEEFFEYCFGDDMEESFNFIKEWPLLKAYYLISYFLNKNHYKKEVQRILNDKFPYTSENNVRGAFEETVKEIEQCLAKQFDINSYKEGESNREQFNKRLFELNNSMAEFREIEKNLLEKIKLYEKETNEIRNEYLELCGKIAVNDRESSESIFGNKITNQTAQIVKNYAFTKECDECSNVYAKGTPCCNTGKQHKEPLSGQLHERVSDEPGGTGKDQQNIKANNTPLESIFGNKAAKQTKRMATDQHHDLPKEHDECSNVHAEEIPCFNGDKGHKESLSGQLAERVSDEPGETDRDQRNIKANNASPESIYGNETTNQIEQMAIDQPQVFSQEHDECSNVNAEEIPCFNRDQRQKESLSGQLPDLVSNEPGETDKDQQNIKANNTSPESIYGNETANQIERMTIDQPHDFSKEHNECSNVHVEEIPCFNGGQLHKESLSNQLPERVLNEPGATDKGQQNIKVNNTYPESLYDNKIANQTAQMACDQCHGFPKENDECSNVHAEETPCFNRYQGLKESLGSQLPERVSNESGKTNKDQQSIKTNSISLESTFTSKTTSLTAQMTEERCHALSKENDECSNVHTKETPSSNRDQLQKKSLSGQLPEIVSNEQNRNLRSHENSLRENEEEKTYEAVERIYDENIFSESWDGSINDWIIL